MNINFINKTRQYCLWICPIVLLIKSSLRKVLIAWDLKVLLVPMSSQIALPCAKAYIRHGRYVKHPDLSSWLYPPLIHFSNSKQAMSANYTKQISNKWYIIKLLIFFLLRSAQQMKNKLLHFLLLEKQIAKNEFISTLRFPGYVRGWKAKKVQKVLRQDFNKPQDQNTNHNNHKTKGKTTKNSKKYEASEWVEW